MFYNTTGFINYYSDEGIIHVKGLIIYKDNASGKDSALSLLLDVFNEKVSWNELFGFFCVVIELSDRTVYFTDNSGMMPLYYSVSNNNCSISSSMITLKKECHIDKTDLNITSVLQFLEYGFVFGNQTFFYSILRCKGDYYYEFNKSCGIKDNIKQITINNSKSKSIFKKKMEKILEAIKKEQKQTGKKLLCDCSGGADSRLIISLAQEVGLDFDLFVRGVPTCADIKVARKIASLLGKKLFELTPVDVKNFSNDNLFRIWRNSDGNYDLFEVDQFIDQYQFKQKKQVLYILGGLAGGEYYRNYRLLRRGKGKEFYYSELDNILRLRIQGVIPHIYEEYRIETDGLLKKIEQKSKNSTNIYYYLNYIFPGSSGILYNIASNYCCNYGPLGESMLAKQFAAPVHFYKKILNRWFRSIISKQNIQLAKEKTIYGMTLYNSFFSYFHDFMHSSFVLVKRVWSKIVFHKMYKPSSFTVSAVTNLDSFINTSEYMNMVEEIHKLNIFQSRECILNVSKNYIGRFMVIYYWLIN